MLNPYSTDDAALRAVARADRYAAQRRYAAMSLVDRRAYADAHPTFTSSDAAPIPESVRFAMADAADVDGPDAAQALFDAYLADTRAAQVAADHDASQMRFGERVIVAGAYTVGASGVACIACPTGYVAAGPHGALVAATAIVCTWALATLYRLCSASR